MTHLRFVLVNAAMHISEGNEKINMVKRLTCLMLSKTVENRLSVEFIYCGCNCGLTRPKYDERLRIRKFIKGHQYKKENNPMWKKKHVAITNEKHPQWRGDKVGYNGLHAWIRRHMSKPTLCPMCLKSPARDLANITGMYTREFKNWAYFCHKCHFAFDNVGIRNKIKR